MSEIHASEKLRSDPAFARLAEVLHGLGRVAVAFSGGVDSSFLAAAAREVLGPDNVLLVTAVSETYGRRERDDADLLAGRLGLERITMETRELDVPGFRDNPPDRCYWCKRELFTRMAALVADRGDWLLCDGSNADDTGDFRPGRRALGELGIRSPLLEAELSKDEIRRLSREMGLPTWSKPAYACLASRFPYGTTISEELVDRVGRAEEVLIDLGFAACRVRHHGDLARIEVPPERVAEIARPEVRDEIVRLLKALGYAYVALDLQGYRTGSLNETLPADVRAADTGRDG